MINPLVSFIIPTYNRPKYLERAVRSALKQTYQNIEILVIDDHSDYDASTLIKRLQDSRVKLYRNEVNQGSVLSRNRGISLCSGDFINFLDDDDEILPRKIELQLAKFQDSEVNELGVVTCDMEYKRRDINEIKRNRLKGKVYKKMLSKYAIYGIHSMLIAKEYIKRFDPSLGSSQEYDLAIRLAKDCSFDFVPKILAITHESRDQISFNYEKKKNGTKYIFKKYRTEFLRFGPLFYIYNWFRFRYLLLKYFIALRLGNTQINKVMYTLHNRLVNNI